jgi:phosphomannomutase/phosphoglucomutase
MDRTIFREYDIRGIAGRDLDRDTVTTIGKAVGTYYLGRGARTTVVGRDARLSSPEIFSWLAEGLRSTGMDVIDAGMIPTPLLYFSVLHFGKDAGVMVTGSHNPPDYNGFKMQFGHESVYGPMIQAIGDIAFSGDFRTGRGALETLEPVPAYIDHVASIIRLERTDIKLVVDAGNGVGGTVAIPAMRRLGLDPIELFCEPDGTFPNHHPDPTVPANLAPLIARVRETGADLGIGYDGDADRIGVVDPAGEILWGDKLLLVFARDILKDNPGATVIGEVKCSKVLYDGIAAAGGRPLMWKTGHSLIKEKIRESGALIGGEMSGHIFFKHRWFGFDDAIYSSLRLVELISRTPGGLPALVSTIPATVSTPEIRTECPEELKFAIVEEVQRIYRARSDVEMIDIDGARVNFKDGWGLLRASNTQPVLVSRFESDTGENLARIRRDVESVLEQAKEAVSRTSK